MIDFYQVNPSRSATVLQAKKHVKDFEVKTPMILDPKQEIARHVAAKVTPETFLISPDGEILYRGRIDDVYAGFGKRRQAPTVHDLRDAITAELARKTVANPSTKPSGCLIQFPAE